MARRYSTLGDVIDQLKENNNTQLDTTDAVDSLTNVLSRQFVQQNRMALEARREAGTSKAKAASSSPRGARKDEGSVVGGGLLAGLGILAGGLGKLVMGAGVGLGAAAAGLGAFFTMLAKADKDLPNGGENVKKLLKNTAEGLAAFTDRDLKAFGTLLGAGALFGAISPIPGLRGIGAGIGIAAIGAGLAGFFTALGAGDMALGAMESTAANLKVFLTNLGEGLSALTNENFIALGGLMGAGGALGALFGVGKTGKAAAGMGLIGAGIAAFLTPLGALDALGGAVGANGSNLKDLLKNIGEGLSAFDAQGLAGMSGLFAAGAIFGLAPGGLAAGGKITVGLGLVGLGLGAFLTALAGVGKVASIIGVDGSGIGKIMKNIAIGMNELSALPADIGAKVKAVGLLGPAMLALMGSQGLGQLGDTVINIAKKASNFLFGTDFKDQATSRKNAIKNIVDSMLPLKNLDMKSVSNLDKLSDALTKFSASITNLGKTNLRNFEKSVKNMVNGMKLQIDLLNAMANGGTVGGTYFGIGATDFGKGFLDPNLKIDQLDELMNKARNVLNKTNINYKPAPEIKSSSSQSGSGSSANVAVDNSNNQNNYNSINARNTSVTNPYGVIDLQDQFGYGYRSPV